MKNDRNVSLGMFILAATLVAVGVVSSAAFGRGYGAPHFWVASALLIVAWAYERRSSDGG